ncbi:hypothetical protein OTK49_00840 [Vibrio coralliirubri]|uniref:hypothetical protein n=1 Tax=Vibrio coralliirubri TaxID=1516159 RepID=UPI0022836EAE|nr:hypothetical protein [Vibrio coralliirubri]MCY9861077.1 hypothetical protein [Vibrio coralliirubri]
MQKLALAALIAASIPMMAVAETAESETLPSEEVSKKTEGESLVFIAPLEMPVEFSVAELDITPTPVLLDASGAQLPLTLEQITKHIQSNNFDVVTTHIDYRKMHTAYLSQMEYINGKVRSLSDRVGEVAAGTFETRVREGSMMLGLISEAIDSIVENAAEDEVEFQKFIKSKFLQLSMVDATYNIEEDNGIYLISIHQPNKDSEDILTAFKLSDGSYKLVAFIPSEMEGINNIINGLFLQASISDSLGDELERRALTEKAIGAEEHRVSENELDDVSSAIEEAQSKLEPEAPTQ